METSRENNEGRKRRTEGRTFLEGKLVNTEVNKGRWMWGRKERHKEERKGKKRKERAKAKKV